MATLAPVGRSIPRYSYSPGILRLVAACFFLSGATGLIYEVLWARMLGLVFGATTLAVSTVLAAFMGGLALGSALAGRKGAGVRRPVRAYGLLEIGIALYALAVPFSLVWSTISTPSSGSTSIRASLFLVCGASCFPA